nr:unnamed protein product [Callosobruchus analis]
MKYLFGIFAIFALLAVFASAEELEERPLVSVRAAFQQEKDVGSCECNTCANYCVRNFYIGGFCYTASCYCVKPNSNVPSKM